MHPTGRHWVEILITSTLLLHQLLRFEREGEWLLQQLCIRRRTFPSMATTTMQDTSHGIASKWLYYCLPRQIMTYSLAHLSADTSQAAEMQCRSTSSGADGNNDWERWSERHHVIPETSGRMDRLISHISIYGSTYQMHSTIATLQIHQTALARRHTEKKVSI